MNILYILSIIFLFVSTAMSIDDSLDIDKMYILLGEKTFLIHLYQNDILQELISILPIKTKILQEDYSKSISIPLSIQKERTNLKLIPDKVISANTGDLILFEGKELILINETSEYNNENGDYIKIGYMKEAKDLFSSVKRNKNIYLLNTLNYENHKGKVKPYGYYTNIMNFLTWKVFTFFCFLLL